MDDEIIICEKCYAENKKPAIVCSQCGTKLFYINVDNENHNEQVTKVKRVQSIKNNSNNPYKIIELQKDVLYRNGYTDTDTQNLSQEEISKLIELEKLNCLTTIKKIGIFFCVLAVIGIAINLISVIKIAILG